jgi:hypothetical protein
MGILRIVSLTAICAVALIDSAYAGGLLCPARLLVRASPA